jgi:hypothetical protein
MLSLPSPITARPGRPRCSTSQAISSHFRFLLSTPHASAHARVPFPETLAHRDPPLTDMQPAFGPPPGWPDSDFLAASRARTQAPVPNAIAAPAWLPPPAPFADGGSIVSISESAVASPRSCARLRTTRSNSQSSSRTQTDERHRSPKPRSKQPPFPHPESSLSVSPALPTACHAPGHSGADNLFALGSRCSFDSIAKAREETPA